MSDHVYLFGRAVGVYEAEDVPFALRQLARDEREGGDAGRLGLYRRALATGLSQGALCAVVREGENADLLRVIEGGPPGPFWVPHEFTCQIREYVRYMTDAGRHHGAFPHERIKLKPRVEPPALTAETLPPKVRKPRKAAKVPHVLSLDDGPPPGFETLFDVEAA